MEISLPLVGLLEEECRISLDEAGVLWLIREGRELPVRISPPSYFHAGPYRFLIREKVEEPTPTAYATTHERPASPISGKHSNKEGPERKNKTRLSAVVVLAAVCLGGTAWYINYSSSANSKGSIKAKTDLPGSSQKTKSTPPNPATTNPQKTTEVAKDPTKARDEEMPAASQVVASSPSSPTREQDRMDLEKLAAKVVPCVFLIEVFDVSGNPIAKGTGFSVSTDGLVATNNHVIENGQTYSLVTNQGAKFDNAEVLASDPDKDLALLKIESKDLPFLTLAESSKVPLGKRVAIYGSPLGLAGSLSEGIISASERDLNESFPQEKIPNEGHLIQTTAPISPGSSGSPLFDAEGKVIGVMTLSLQKNSQNLNFAVPVEALKSLIDRARDNLSLVRQRPQISQEAPSATNSEVDAAIEDEPAYRRLSQNMSVNNWVESLKITGFLTDKYPNSSLAHFQNGYCAGMLRLDHQAELSYKRAIELDPSNQLAWNNLGLVLRSQKKFESALLAFEKAVSLNPNYPQAWDNVLRTNILLSNWPKATTALNTLVQIDLEMARDCARLLVNLRIPDADFRNALQRTMAQKVGNSASNGNLRFRVVGVSADDPLAVRSGPGASFPRVISITNGAEVFVTGDSKMNGSTEWLPVDFGNSSGWVARKYLQAAE